MVFSLLLRFNRTNRRMILLLIACQFIWLFLIFGLWAVGNIATDWHPVWPFLFLALQIYAASQLILPVLMMVPEQRSRLFYLSWAVLLSLSIWGASQIKLSGTLAPLWETFRSSLLLLTATITGAALARYVKRPWEIVPICIAMTLADFLSWLNGPTAVFSEQIINYYRHPVGEPPVVDLLLVKLASPGVAQLIPVFGVSDWIMVVFFAVVAHRHSVNDNLLIVDGNELVKRGRFGGYLPVSVLALLVALIAAHVSGAFIPALPVVALVMLLWYLGRKLFGFT